MSAWLAPLGGLLVVLLGPLCDGLTRCVRAWLHSRKGPSITQTYTDIFKLFGKEDLDPGGGAVFRLAPPVALAAFAGAGVLLPWGASGADGPGDVIGWVYLLTLGASAQILAAFAAGNPFASAGGSREVMLLLSVEPITVAALVTAALKAGTLSLPGMAQHALDHGLTVSLALAAGALLLSLQAAMGRLPCDIAEAEGEIVEGPLLEYSGPSLGLMRLALLARQVVCAGLLTQVLLPWPGAPLGPLAVLVSVAKVLVIFALSAVVEAVSPRMRIDQALRYLGQVLFVGLAALAFAAIGA